MTKKTIALVTITTVCLIVGIVLFINRKPYVDVNAPTFNIENDLSGDQTKMAKENNMPSILNVPIDADKSNYIRMVLIPADKPFYASTTEITQKQWKAVMGVNNSYFRGDDNPATSFTYKEAIEFCNKITQQEKNAGRIKANEQFILPTAEMWRFACRGNSKSQYCYGSDDVSPLKEYAWFAATSGSTTHKVGLLKPNLFGLYDIHGNVSEMTTDYTTSKKTSMLCLGGDYSLAARWLEADFGDYLGFNESSAADGLRLFRTIDTPAVAPIITPQNKIRIILPVPPEK